MLLTRMMDAHMICASRPGRNVRSIDIGREPVLAYYPMTGPNGAVNIFFIKERIDTHA